MGLEKYIINALCTYKYTHTYMYIPTTYIKKGF